MRWAVVYVRRLSERQDRRRQETKAASPVDWSSDLQRQRDHKDAMGDGVELDMSDVITEWRMNTQRNLCYELVGYGINDGHILIFQGYVRIIGVAWNSRVSNKDPVIDWIVFDSIRAVMGRAGPWR